MNIPSGNLATFDWSSDRDFFDHDSAPTGEITLCAVNRDNHRDSERLVELFESHYGSGYPFKPIYDTNYWSSEGEYSDQENRATSIVAVDGDRFVAHLGVQRTLADRDTIELLLPAVAPDYRRQLSKLTHLYWKCLQTQAMRQRWKLIFHYAFLNQPLAQVVTTRGFQFKELALIPDTTCMKGSYEAQLKRPDNGMSLLLTYLPIFPIHREPLPLFLPKRHSQKIQEIYEPLHLRRSFSEEAIPAPTPNLRQAIEVNGVDNGEPGLTVYFEERLALYRMNIHPEEVVSIENIVFHCEQLLAVAARDNTRLCLRVAADHPLCPTICDALEDTGYRFCGVLPMSAERDYLMFSKFDNEVLKQLSLYTQTAKNLRDYLIRCS